MFHSEGGRIFREVLRKLALIMDSLDLGHAELEMSVMTENLGKWTLEKYAAGKYTYIFVKEIVWAF